jgi:hypothetical protein
MFRIPDIPFGHYEVALDDDRLMPAAESLVVDVEDRVSTVTLSVTEPCPVEGLVTGLEPNPLEPNPLPPITVRAVGSGLTIRLQVQGASGTVRGTLPPGRWRIEGRTEGETARPTGWPGSVEVLCEDGEPVIFELAL